jgi:prophage DNA circulation protein
MAWKDNLLDCSFKGIKFEVQRTRDAVQWATVEHAYPYKDGADIEDLGQGPRKISVEAIFFGDDYETRLQAFLKELQKGASGELIHPVFGSLTVQLYDYDIGHEADNVDSATVTLQFGETLSETQFFDRQLAGQTAEAAGLLGESLRTLSGNVFADMVGSILGNARRVAAFQNAASGMLNGLLAQVSGVVLSGQNVLDFPRSFLTDVGAVVSGVVALWPFDAGTRRADFDRTRVNLTTPLTLPDTYISAASQTDIERTAAHVRLEQSLGLVDAATIVLSQEAENPTLTPPEIERITGDARTEIQARIDEIRSAYGLEESRTLTEPLKDIALALQTAAAAVIEQSPPLITRIVEAPGNLHLLAHRWYGDYSRASELLRLNPSVRLPNNVNRGEVLNAFAQ